MHFERVASGRGSRNGVRLTTLVRFSIQTEFFFAHLIVLGSNIRCALDKEMVWASDSCGNGGETGSVLYYFSNCTV